MEWNNDVKNEQGRLLYEWFLLYCNQLGLTTYKECTELLGAATMFYLQCASEPLVAPMEELREEYVDMLNNAYFERND